MRILVIGNAGEREPGRRYYSVERKLANGFVRNGHSVWFFSDRDVARAGTIFRSSRAGRGVANAKFLEATRHYAPHAIVFAHACLIATEIFAQAKAGGARLAQVCVDPLFRAVNGAFLSERAGVTDATFVTTAGAALARFATAGNVSAFIPNPVDASIEDLRNFERDDLPLDVFFAANAGGDRADDPRRATPRLLRQSAQLACGFHGFDGAPGLYGAAYFAGLGAARMGLNLNSDRAETASAPAPAEELYLYNSDRVSQLVGCGLLTLSYETNSYGELFEPEREMAFAATPEAMLEAALRFKRDDAARRRIAQAGWRKAHEAYNERVVARFIEEVLFRRPLSPGYQWPTRIW
ncbi:MAG: glycosyltransferase family 1 protein [Pseudomonadota bacterium]|nr:glycosyltransferase family 1 protein [Pseudomonadota bacterium]